MSAPAKKSENLLVNLVCNIAIPTLVLSKLSGPEKLGPTLGLVVALLFPLGYGIYDFVKRRETNFVSIIGFISVLLTGGLGLLKVGGIWFAIKEAGVPFIIGLVVLVSMKTKRPLVKTMLYNPQVIDIEKVESALDSRGERAAFDRLLLNSSYWLVASFLLSAVLNFLLAHWLLTGEPGSTEFNAQLGKMNLLSWPVIVVPSTGMMMFALFRLLKGITRLSGLSMEEVFHGAPKEAPANEAK